MMAESELLSMTPNIGLGILEGVLIAIVPTISILFIGGMIYKLGRKMTGENL